MLNVTTLTMSLQMQSISISRTVLLKTSLVKYLVALTPAKTTSITSMICLMILEFSLEELVVEHMFDDDY